MRMRAPRTDVKTRSLSRPNLTDDARWESRSPSFSSASSPRRRCAFSWYVNSRAHDKPRVGSHSRARVREMSNPATRRHSGSLASRRPVRRVRSLSDGNGSKSFLLIRLRRVRRRRVVARGVGDGRRAIDRVRMDPFGVALALHRWFVNPWKVWGCFLNYNSWNYRIKD